MINGVFQTKMAADLCYWRHGIILIHLNSAPRSFLELHGSCNDLGCLYHNGIMILVTTGNGISGDFINNH